MKFTVLGFQQQKLMDNNLTLEDAFLLSVIKDMYASDRMESIIQDNKRYIWINQSYLLEQIPILGSISKLKRMLNKLCEDGFLESILVTNKKGVAGRFYYVKYTNKLSELQDYDTKVQNDTRLDKIEETKVQNDTRPNVKMTLNQSSKRANKDSSINDSSIKDNITEEEPQSKKKYSSEIKEISMYLKDKLVTNGVKVFPRDWHLKNYSIIKRFLGTMTKEEVIKAIDWGLEHKYWKDKIDGMQTVNNYLPKYQLQNKSNGDDWRLCDAK